MTDNISLLISYDRGVDEQSKLKKGTQMSAGYDIASMIDCYVSPHGKLLVRTGIKMAIPSGYYGRIAPRSSLALKSFIDVGAGVIDSDYRGEVGVLLFNHSDIPFVIKKNDRIAQLIVERHYSPEIVECSEERLGETNRGEGGFGSTGK